MTSTVGIIEFVEARAAEDAVLCRAVDPVDSDLLASSRIATRLIRGCAGRLEHLTPRQWQVMQQLAARHSRHVDFDPLWCFEDQFPG